MRLLLFIRKFLSSLINSGTKADQNFIQTTRIRFNNIAVLGAIIIVLNFILFDIFRANYELILLYFLIGFGLISVFIVNRYYPRSVAWINLIVGLTIILFLTLTGGVSRTGIIWFLTAPPVFFFIQDTKPAFFSITLYFFLFPIFIIFQNLGLITTPYSTTEYTQVIAAYLLISIMSFIYSKVNQTYQKELEGNIEKLKAIDKLKNEFISLASHQLRTPLTAMKWFLEMMVNGEMGEVSLPQKGGLENIYKSNERMIALVNALLNVSRLDTGRVAVNPRPTRLRELVDSVTSDFQVMIKNKNFQIILNEAPNLPQISIDPQLIRIVYSNLLSNAIRYTPAGGQITISLYPKENFIISEIKDTGYGIPQTEQGRVFEKFFRASNIVRIDTEGTGLGLYLTRAIIESSGGKIWFESIEGRGTTFYFSLPLEGSLAKPGEVGVEQTK